MKKRNTKKGFTLVELVIVIAVIAILAGVLIPTFSNVVKNAQESAAIQEATNAYKEAYALAMVDGILADNEQGIKVADGKPSEFTHDTTKYKAVASIDTNGKITWTITFNK